LTVPRPQAGDLRMRFSLAQIYATRGGRRLSPACCRDTSADLANSPLAWRSTAFSMSAFRPGGRPEGSQVDVAVDQRWIDGHLLCAGRPSHKSVVVPIVREAVFITPTQ